MESRNDLLAEIKSKELQDAVIALDKKKVSQLLANGALPSLLVNGTTALHLAVKVRENAKDEEHSLVILDKLLDENVNIHQLVDGRPLMAEAGHNHHWHAVLMIANRCESDENDTAQFGSALLDAVRYCEDEDLLIELVEALLEQGAKANLHNKYDGFTVVHWAVWTHRPKILRMLLDGLPDGHLKRSAATEKHGESRTPARMAYDMYCSFDRPNLTADEELAKKQLWECICVIAEMVYQPIIDGRTDKFSASLIQERDILLAYICSLPPKERLATIIDGQNEFHPLGKLNLSAPAIVDLYFEAQRKTQEQIKRLSKSPLSHSHALRQSPQLFQSAPRRIEKEHDIDAYVTSQQTQEDATLFHLTPPSPEVAALMPHSPAIQIKTRFAPSSVSAIFFPGESYTTSSARSGSLSPLPSPRSKSPTPSSSPSKAKELIDKHFKATPSSVDLDDNGIKSPKRF